MELLIIAGLVAVGIFLWRQRHGARLQSWRNAAEELGLVVSAGSMLGGSRMTGRVQGFPVEVELGSNASTGTELAATAALAVVFRTRSSSVRTWTRYEVRYPDLDLGLRLSRQTAFTSITTVFGGMDAEIGDEVFDSAFRIETDLPSKAKLFFTPMRRDSLHRLLATYRDLEVFDTEMRLERDGWEHDALTIVSVVRRMVAAAKTLSSDVSGSGGVDRAIGLRVQGDVADAAQALEEMSSADSDDLDVQLLEVDALVAAGNRDRAAIVVKDLEPSMPKDPEVVGWRDRIADDASVTPVSDEIDTDAVAEAQRLFGEARLSFETNAIFEEEFLGRRIRWFGRVRNARLLESDRDFGNQPLTKALIGVASITNDLYGNVEVDAVVAFPPETANELNSGDEVTFTGRLHKVDALTRNIYVVDGNLV